MNLSPVPVQADEFSYWVKGTQVVHFNACGSKHLPAEHGVLCKLYTAACRSLEAQGSINGW